VIGEALAGRRILVTGASGFLGQAVLERLLAEIDGARILLLLRARGRTSAQQRVDELLGKPVFSALRERLGEDGLRARAAEQIEVVEGDVTGTLPVLPADLDVVLHCAATVSFDPPIDEAFRINLLGTRALYEGLLAAGATPHIVHVSTAYVAGIRNGVVPEAPLDHRVDWHAEADAALAARQEAERASRRPEVLQRCIDLARGEHNRAGAQTVAADAERRRAEWVTDRLVRLGTLRAQSLGWPDVYTLTKALSERATEQLLAGRVPLSILRPSIIESALAHPYPGWIEGFKMADPIILAYGRGAIPEFPGIPDGIIDMIPVDLVANALVAVAASPPEPEEPAYYHVSSGTRNPLSFHRLYELVRGYFEANPLPDAGRGTVRVPEWRFPGRRRVEGMLRTGERLVDVADKAVGRMPRSARMRELVVKVDRQRRRLEFVRRYADLYGAYTEAEVIYTDDAATALWRQLPAEDQARFAFDPAAYDWRHYLVDVHCPSVTTLLRLERGPRTTPRVRLSADTPQAVAVFDLEGTLIDSNVIETYLWVRLADLPPSRWPSELAALARSLPGYLAAERRDRGQFLRSFYRRYEGASVDALEALIADHVQEIVLQRVVPAGVRRVRQHRAAGHRTILITGALEPLIAPLAPLFDEVQAARLSERDGRFTGFLSEPPLVGEARAAWLRQHARYTHADLGRSYAYGDSHSDLPMLRAVGHAVAVNPDAGLYRAARRSRWPVEEWAPAADLPALTRRVGPVAVRAGEGTGVAR
jgi:alcohol-forming fatty acyl-CoA reductase